MSPKTEARPPEPDSSYAEFRSGTGRNTTPTFADRDLVFWTYLTAPAMPASQPGESPLCTCIVDARSIGCSLAPPAPPAVTRATAAVGVFVGLDLVMPGRSFCCIEPLDRVDLSAGSQFGPIHRRRASATH